MQAYKHKITGLEQITKSAKDLENLHKPVRKAIQSFVKGYGREVLEEVRTASPIASGAFRDAWRMTHGSNATTIISLSIRNRSVQSQAIEEGSSPGEAPWPNATKGKKRTRNAAGKLSRKPSEKTILSKGRIWSTQAIGGVTAHVKSIQPGAIISLSRRLNGVIQEAILGALK